MSDPQAGTKPWIVVSFFTIGTGYEKEVEGLKASLAAFEIPSRIDAVPSRGTWLLNVQGKPGFLRWLLDELAPRDLVWLDADAKIRQYPDLFDRLSAEGQADIAVHYRNKIELLTGTIWIRNSPGARHLLESWFDFCLKNPAITDQRALQTVIQAAPGRWKISALPANYVQIFDLMRNAGKPTIEHFQASRRFKKTLPVGGILSTHALAGRIK
jgi:hypothetical protein